MLAMVNAAGASLYNCGVLVLQRNGVGLGEADLREWLPQHVTANLVLDLS